jgi:hypothetical protein
MACSACQKYNGVPVNAYQQVQDRVRVLSGLASFFPPCWRDENTPRGKIETVLPTDQCYRMQPQRRWRGLWRNDFEGFKFCEEPAKTCQYDSRGGMIRLLPQEIGGKYDKPPFGGLYRVEFIGRRTLHGGGLSISGKFKHSMVIDRLISIEEVEPPPQQQ